MMINALISFGFEAICDFCVDFNRHQNGFTNVPERNR